MWYLVMCNMKRLSFMRGVGHILTHDGQLPLNCSDIKLKVGTACNCSPLWSLPSTQKYVFTLVLNGFMLQLYSAVWCLSRLLHCRAVVTLICWAESFFMFTETSIWRGEPMNMICDITCVIEKLFAASAYIMKTGLWVKKTCCFQQKN